MVPLIQAEIVDQRKWLGPAEFVDQIGIAQAAPGPIAVNVAVMVGYRLLGLKGALVAAGGAVIPSFLAILAVAWTFGRAGQSRLLEEAFRGIRPAVVGLVAVAAWRIGRVSLVKPVDFVGAVAAIGALLALHWHPIAVILIGGVAGLVASRTRTS